MIKTPMKSMILLALACCGLPWIGVQAEEPPFIPSLDFPKDQLSAMPKVEVKAFQLEGNQVISTADLQQRIQSYTGRTITAEELQTVRTLITKYYIQQGYINSGAIIPDQQVQDGVIRLEIIEGKLTEVELSGIDGKPLRWKKELITSRVTPDLNAPLNTRELQEKLQILQQNPLIERFNAELGPGLRPGEAVLNLELQEADPLEYGFSFNNHRSPSVGALRLESHIRHRNLTGHADSVFARLGLSEGLNDFTVEYTVPVTRHDTTLNFRAERSDSQVVTEPFDMLDIESTATTYAVTARHPFHVSYQDINRNKNQDEDKSLPPNFHYRVFDMGLGLEKRRSETKLLGEPFSFPPLPQEAKGISRVTALRFSQNWLDRGRDRVIAIASTFGFGLDALDSTINDGLDADGNATVEPDSEFVTWVGQFRWVERLEKIWDSQLRLRLDVQYSDDDLLALEKFAIGGANTVRGYRENQLTRDHGMVASVEWHVPVGQVRIPRLSEENQGQVTLVPFLDYGSGGNVDLPENGPDFISSAGLGVLWQPHAQLNLELFWAKPLQTVADSQDHDLQDEGIHFRLDLNFD